MELSEVGTPSRAACSTCGESFLLAQREPDTTIGGLPRKCEKLGRFELLEVVGVGAFGTVYKARDPELERIVAIKVPRGSSLLEGQELDRFVREARSVARLRHPSIVTVHEVGQVGDIPYLVSDFVEGVTLADVLSVRRPTPHEAAQLMADLADALDYAHEHGVIHRDVKPSNIMLEMVAWPTHQGERPAFSPGTPRLMDFGLAKRDAGETTVTMDGQVLGTPAYMSPEQARGESHHVDRRTDIYSLGVILYQLLTGELPFRGTTRMLLHQVLHEEPRPPRKLNDRIPRDLETICLKALAKEPNRRYQTARELAEDLRRFLREEPIRARPVGRLERTWRWCRRNPRVAALAAAVASLLVVIAVGASTAAVWLRQERNRIQEINERLTEQYQQTDTQRQRAEKAERERTAQLWQSLLREAQAERWSGRAGRRFNGLKALAEATRIARDLEAPPDRILQLRNEAVACLVLPDLRVAREWDGFPEGSSALGFDADLRRYARGNVEGDVSIRRVADDTEIVNLRGPKVRAQAFLFSPNGRYLFAGYHHNSPREFWVWDLTRAEPVFKLDPGDHDNGVDFSPDSRYIAFGHSDGTIRLYELAVGTEVRRLGASLRPAAPSALRFAPDGRKLAIGSLQAPGVEIRDLGSGRTFGLAHPSAVRGVAWRADGKLLATASDDHNIYIWDVADLEQPRQVHVLKGHIAQVVRLAFSHGGDLLASRGWDGTTRLWHALTGRVPVTVEGIGADYFLRFSPDDGLLSPSRQGSKVYLWEVATGRECRTFVPDKVNRRSAAVSPDGRLLACPGNEGSLQLYDLLTNKEVASLPVRCSHAGFDPSGQLLLTSGVEGIWRWPLKRETTAAGPTLKIGPPELWAIPGERLTRYFSSTPDARSLVVAASSESALVIHKDKPKETILLSPHPGLEFVALSPDGQWAATGTWHATGVKIWDARAGQFIQELPVKDSANVGFSRDGKWLVTSTGEEYRFWQAGSWRPALRIARQGAGPGHIVFTPDSRMLAIAASVTAVRLIDLETGHELATLPTTGEPLCFSPDGSQLITTAEGGAVQVWDLRLIRQQLVAMGLDWNHDDYPPAPLPETDGPLQAIVLLGDLAAALPQTTGTRELRMRAAIAHYRLLVAAKPEDAQACRRLAWLYAAAPPPLRDPAEALRLARKAMELAPHQPETQHTLALAYYTAGQYRHVLETLHPHLKSQPDRYMVIDLYLLAMTYYRLGDSTRAQEYHALADRWSQMQQNLSEEEAEILDAFRAEANALFSGNEAVEK